MVFNLSYVCQSWLIVIGIFLGAFKRYILKVASTQLFNASCLVNEDKKNYLESHLLWQIQADMENFMSAAGLKILSWANFLALNKRCFVKVLSVAILRFC